MKVEVTVLNNDSKMLIKGEEGINLLHLLNKNNIMIVSPCGGSGTCGKCKVKLNNGNIKLSDSELNLLTEDEINQGYRLACCLKVIDDLEIELVEEGQILVVTEGMDFKIDFNPQLKVYNLPKDNSHSENSMSYLDILYKESSTNDTDLSILQELPNIIEEENISLLSYEDRIISIANNTINKVFGLAVDIGTTTVAVYLLNLLTGAEIDVDSFHNPQKNYGADVISRINYVQKDNEKLNEMQNVLIKELNSSIKRLTLRNSLKPDDVYLVTVVGNTTMTHLLLGVNPQSLANTPYRPIYTNSMEITPDEINLDINSDGVIQILPAVSAYIGSDIIADLLVTDFSSEAWNLLIDIGTNGEIVLGNKQEILACSAAAGPAFEGAKITFGMAGVPGAISSFNILSDKKFKYETIGSKPPIGICGSGLIDILAEMVENNILTRTGMFNQSIDTNLLSKITSYKNMKALKIVDINSSDVNNSILLTQKDVREVQLAKGAIAAGINILLKEAGISYNNINNIYLAGGFGSFIDPINACKIGLFPRNMEKKIVKIGNGAGLGVKNYILDKTQKERVKSLLKNINYLELSLRKDFQDEFMKSMEF